MSNKVAPITYRITFKSQPSRAATATGHDAPVDVRLANLLKYAGRACGFKCVGIETVDEHRLKHPQNVDGCATCEYLQDELPDEESQEPR